MKVAAEADRLRREGVDVVDFSVGEPDFPTPANVKDAAIAAIHGNFTKYTPAGGTVELKQAILNRHRTDYGTDYKMNECIAGVGGKHEIFNLMQVLINPGDEVIVPVPYWVTFKDVVNYAGGTCVYVDTDEQGGFNLTADMLKPWITPRTKALIVNSPSNPSGAVIPRAELEKIHALAKLHNFWIITDECYCRFLYDGEPFSMASLPGAKDTVIVAGSLSKTYAFTGWRIGFALAPAPVITAINNLQSHSTSNPTSIAQKAAIEALNGPQDSIAVMMAEYRRRRDYVMGRLRALPGITVQEPRGAFYAYPNIAGVLGARAATPFEFCEKLLTEAHVATVPGEAFGTDRHFRLSYATSMDQLEKGLDCIQAFLSTIA
jgi:aspartate aminotransferase